MSQSQRMDEPTPVGCSCSWCLYHIFLLLNNNNDTKKNLDRLCITNIKLLMLCYYGLNLTVYTLEGMITHLKKIIRFQQ